MQCGIIGSGSWATALAKLLTDNNHPVQWWVRSASIAEHLKLRGHNPQYLSSVEFNKELVIPQLDIAEVFQQSDVIVIAVPSAYVLDVFESITPELLKDKKIVSAVKGMLPQKNLLLNEYLKEAYDFPISQYYSIMGPCHAEEVADEKLSYLTFSGEDRSMTDAIANQFNSTHLRTVVNDDLFGVQYAAVLKNIYALGAGIAHGLEYGDNFLSVWIANCADEMAGFLRQIGIENIEVGVHNEEDPITHLKSQNYAASVYLGDLLVTCYSLHSRNRTFGNMIGKGYSVKTAQLEMNMVAEGYNASKCIYDKATAMNFAMPIATSIYKILWEGMKPKKAFKEIEGILV